MAAVPTPRVVEHTPPPPAELFFLRSRADDSDEVDFADFDFAAGTIYSEAIVRFLDLGRVARAEAGEMTLRRGDLVMVDLDRSLVLATVVSPSRRRYGRPPSLRVGRRANEGDQHAEAERRRREQEAFRTCNARIHALDLTVKLVRVELSGAPANRLTCLLASEEKLELRELARELTRDLVLESGVRLELRQIGIRDSTKVIGGVGPCGLQLCCNTFLQDFAPVSIRHAKDQALVLNPAKISGVCGRLMCCLVYEEAFYRVNRKLLPKIGKRVITPHGEGRVRDVDVLKQTARIELMDPTAPSRIIEVRASEIQPVNPPQGPAAAREEPDAEPDDDGGDEPSGPDGDQSS